MLLIVDIGNTYTKFKSLDNNFSYRLKTDSYKSSYDLEKVFPIEELNINSSIISSVSLNKDKIVKEFIDKRFNINSMIVSKDMKTINEYPLNHELGSDLIAMMEAASIKSNTNITISLGTATVLNLIIDRKYVGTVISPGILTSLNGLINSASLIEETDLKGSYNLLGTTTEECLKTGVFNGFTFLVDGFINEIKNKYNLDDIDVYIVGGFSSIIAPKLKNKNIVDEELIIKGLSSLYQMNRG